jgi:hypothetical protein
MSCAHLNYLHDNIQGIIPMYHTNLAEKAMFCSAVGILIDHSVKMYADKI